MRPAPPRLALLPLAAAAAGGAEPAPEPRISFECADPLFKVHWFGSGLDFSHLQGTPEVYTRLARCPLWNNRRSCCNPSMEAPQQVAFDSWLHQLGLQVNLLKFYFRSMQTLSQGEVYKHSEDLERALFDRALGAFPPALALARRCVRAVMAFVAGMICFSCEPRWDDFVWRNADGGVTAVNVSGDSCIYVDQRCGPFGKAVNLLTERVMESTIAKMPKAALPDFSMLKDRITSCEWLRGTVALQPLRSGAVAGRRLAPVDDFDPFAASGDGADKAVSMAALTVPTTATSTGTTTTEAAPTTTASLPPPPPRPTAPPLPTAPPGATAPRLALDPVRDGLRSGFHFPPE